MEADRRSMRAMQRAALMLAALVAVPAAVAQQYPSKPIRVMVGYAPGISVDLTARITSAEMSKRLGVPMIVENRPGANGSLSLVATRDAAPDGYTIAVGGVAPNHPVLVRNNPMILNKDLLPVGNIAAASWVAFVRSGLGFKTWADLVAYSKANPGKLNYGAVSSQIDLFMEMLKSRTGLTYTAIRYKGAPVKEMLSGELDFYFGTMSGMMQHISAGKIDALLATVKPEVLSGHNVQTVADIGLPMFAIRSRWGIAAPMGTPREVLQRLESALAAVINTPAVVEPIRKLGFEVDYLDAQQLTRAYEAEIAFFTEAARLAKFVPEQ